MCLKLAWFIMLWIHHPNPRSPCLSIYFDWRFNLGNCVTIGQRTFMVAWGGGGVSDVRILRSTLTLKYKNAGNLNWSATPGSSSLSLL